jgi:ligand-binding sensor domain-containing protein/signal transduction histidine kinase
MEACAIRHLGQSPCGASAGTGPPHFGHCFSFNVSLIPLPEARASSGYTQFGAWKGRGRSISSVFNLFHFPPFFVIILCVPPCRSSFASRHARVCLTTLSLAASLSVFGAVPEYFAHLWQTEDGLPQNSVTAIVQTRDGYLWMGTYGALTRFDGARFVVFDGSTTPELKSSRVTCLFEDSSGSLWIGQETGELTRYRDGRFETVKAPASGKGRRIFALGSDESEDLWLINEEGLMTRLRDNLVLVPEVGHATGQVAFARDARGHIWLACAGRASRLEKGKLLPVDFADGASNAYVQGIYPSRAGGVWVASDGRIRKWQDNQWTQDLGDAPWGLTGLTYFLETRNGFLLGGTVEMGLYIVVPEHGTLHFNHTNGLPQDWVRTLCEDREGNLWLGAGSGGLVALRAGKVATLSPPDRWQGRTVLSMVATESGMWIGTEGAGLYRVNDGQWDRFAEAAGIGNPFVWSLSQDKQGRIWAGTWGGGVFVGNDGRFSRPTGLENFTAPVPALLQARDGSTWLGTGIGLVHYEAGQITRFGEDEGLDLPDVRTLEEAPDGTLWFGMCGGGLGRLREGTLKQFTTADGLSSDFVQALHLDSDGTLWIGTSGGGLNRMKQQQFSVISKSQGLSDNVICRIAEDEQGYMWLGSHGGIMRINKNELNLCANGATNRVDCLVYGKGEGMPTLECTGGLQPSGCKTSDGRLWFPTSRGLVIVNPREVKANQLPPPVLIEEVMADGKSVLEEVMADGKSVLENPAAPTPLRLPPGRQRFEFHYTGLSFTVPEKVRFRYRLENLEPDWVDAGTKRMVNYAYIPPGDYTFRVTACNNDGVWNEQGASLSLTVLPHFWQTWWFRVTTAAAGAAAVAGLVLAITRRRMRQKLERLERQRAVERERTRIAKDIHDDLGASLTRITLLSQSARAEMDHVTPASSELDRIYDTAREMTRAMDEIVWAVNPKHDTLDSLASYLGRFAQDFLAAAHIRCRLDVPTQLPAWPLTADIRHNLFLAFKEALNNAVKHSGTSEVRILLEIHEKGGRAPANGHQNGIASGFVLRVEDQGCGFSANGASEIAASSIADRLVGGNGLPSMRQRLAEIGGRCVIESSPGSGASVTFIVPVKVLV